MSTLKSYHIHHLEAQSKQMQKEYCRLRELIKLGDMQAVEEISELKKNVYIFGDRLLANSIKSLSINRNIRIRK